MPVHPRLLEELRRIDLFSGLGAAQLERLGERCFRRTFGAGETIIREYETGASLFLILSGRVAVTKLDAMGERVHLAERGPGEVLGEMSLLDGGPRSSDVVTLIESEFLILDRSSFVSVLENSPEMAMAIIVKLSERLRQADAERSRNRPVRERLAHLIYVEARQKRELSDGKAGPIVLTLPRKDLAERVRASRETVSREISAMVAAGVLELDGRAILVKNVGALKRMFGG